MMIRIDIKILWCSVKKRKFVGIMFFMSDLIYNFYQLLFMLLENGKLYFIFIFISYDVMKV